MSEQNVLFLRKGLIGTCAFVALVMLATFYSVVSGAVERAARQRGAVEVVPHASATTNARPSARGSAMLAGVDN
ncbi:MAG TPA: hypothetical protein VGO85_02135 [Caldimonas sp.]|nr:hypothetical protein [Caldimonas sp.]